MIAQVLEETDNPTKTWTRRNARPTRILSPTLKSDGNEVAIQTIEIAHEGLTIESR